MTTATVLQFPIKRTMHIIDQDWVDELVEYYARQPHASNVAELFSKGDYAVSYKSVPYHIFKLAVQSGLSVVLGHRNHE